MGLQLYNKKRNFKGTPEPAGKGKSAAPKLVFVVQRHKASHLHYDFRLEINGTLKSWAVPKGPSLNPDDKRLAMMVEDHPFRYRTFEGVIPEGNYGAGIVEIWDEGHFSDPDNSDKKTAEKKLGAALKAGNLKFTLYGKKLKGEFALVKLRNGKQENAWLLIKHRDKYAVNEPYSSEAQTAKSSPINKALAKENPEKKKRVKTVGKSPVKKAVKKAASPRTAIKKKGPRYLPGETRKLEDYIKPMLARETDTPFSDKEWIYEIKWDGYRAIAEVNKEKVLMYSRNGNTFNGSYPILIKALAELGIKAVLDGEVVVPDEEGKSDFQLLQYYEASYPLQYRVFDVLSINDKDLTQLPLIERKARLKKLLPESDLVKYSEHIEEKGLAFFNAARDNDLEGIIAKKADSLYIPGLRTDNWLKVKHHKTQESVIAGFTAPGGSRRYFGALVLGVKKSGRLRYAGHTGSGFTAASLADMSRLLKPLIQKTSPFDEQVKTNMPVTWVKPVLVCEIKYTEITSDGRMRHPIFLRLRQDKTTNDVNTESMVKSPKDITKKTAVKKKAKKPTVKKTKPEAEGNTLSFGNIKVKTSNPDKVFWPGEGITKGDVIAYYQSIAPYILPYLQDRPQSLKRNPNGIHDTGFYQKDAGGEAPAWVKSKILFSESTSKDIHYILCNNAATLAYLNNLGCIEINPWHSTIKALDKPDYLIIDIDPSAKNTFEQVIETANVVNGIFKKAGAPCYCKTSGATGLHVYVPTAKKYSYGQLKDFAHLICIMTQEQLPRFTSLERNLSKRGNKMIYLDHLQNRRGQTICSVYSLRPYPNATVSMPLKWSEVKSGLDPKQFTIHNALKRIEKTKTLFSGILGPGIDLQKCLSNLEK